MNIDNLFYTEEERDTAKETDIDLESCDTDLSIEEIDNAFTECLSDVIEDLDLLRTQHREIRAKIFVRRCEDSERDVITGERFKEREDDLTALMDAARNFLSVSQK